MSIRRYIIVLFLSLLAVAQAIREQGSGLGRTSRETNDKVSETGKKGEQDSTKSSKSGQQMRPISGSRSRSLKKSRLPLQRIPKSKDSQPEVTPSQAPPAVQEKSKSFEQELATSITEDSTLKDVNTELQTIRKKMKGKNPDMGSAEINDHLLAILNHSGYTVKHHPLSLINEALKGKHYDFLKTFYPATVMLWCDGEDLAEVLDRAADFPEWMSKDELRENIGFAIREGHTKPEDWELRFRTLIRFGGEDTFKDKRFKDLIFKNKVFGENFGEIIQEAYDAKNFAFLKSVPFPSVEYPLSEKHAVLFWKLAYREDWCSQEWERYLNTVADADVHRILEDHGTDLFGCRNSKVFQSPHVRVFLRVRNIDDSLRTAFQFNSSAFARYLKEFYGLEKFKLMVKECSQVDTIGMTLLAHKYNDYSGCSSELSSVYSLLLDEGKELDINAIRFSDVPLLGKKYLRPLISRGFNKGPTRSSDFRLYGRTETGIEFLKAILRGYFRVDGMPLKLEPSHLRDADLKILDPELFKLIDKHFEGNSEAQEEFRRKRATLAVKERNIKLLVDADPAPNFTHPRFAMDLSFEARKGNLTALDWIFGVDPLFLHQLPFTFFTGLEKSSSYVPFLKYLFKKSKEPSDLLVGLAKEHIDKAVNSNDKEYYDGVCVIEGLDTIMKNFGHTIPEFPKEEQKE